MLNPCRLKNLSRLNLSRTILGSSSSRDVLPTTRSFHSEFVGGETEDDYHEGPLYDTHIPTNIFQKSLLAVGSAVAGLADPWRADMVAVNGEVLGLQALKSMHARMLDSVEGNQVLHDRPRMSTTTIDFDYLKSLPPNTFGRVCAEYNEKHHISPDSRDSVHFVDDPDLAYVMQRYRENHDVVHAILDMPTDMVGEVMVKWVEGLQTGLPMCIGGAILGPLRFKRQSQINRFYIYRPWAIRVGSNAKFLMNVYYEKRWEQDVKDLRRELRIEPPPIIPSVITKKKN